jgi:RNA polymerase sigma-70 factor (ECF subfamily)
MPSTDSAARIASLDVEPGPVVPNATAGVPSFPRIYELYFNFVWSCARRLGVSEAEIDDVVQEIFIVIHSRVHTLEQPGSLRSWIYGIVRRTVSTYHRAKRAKLASALTLSAEPDMQYPQQPSPQQLAE